MNINKLVHEARGLCWHEWEVVDYSGVGNTQYLYGCMLCGDESGTAEMPDYDMNACMAIVEEVRTWPVKEKMAWLEHYSLLVKAEFDEDLLLSMTPEAIMKAYLKSKGVEVQTEVGPDKETAR